LSNPIQNFAPKTASVNVAELSQRLPEYLKQVRNDEEVVIILHGRATARIVLDRQKNERETVLNRLNLLQNRVVVNPRWYPDASG
jgi:antitoxin (DNA-binding transcriptional repressor) of toxin-antitoxin stability system